MSIFSRVGVVERYQIDFCSRCKW